MSPQHILDCAIFEDCRPGDLVLIEGLAAASVPAVLSHLPHHVEYSDVPSVAVAVVSASRDVGRGLCVINGVPYTAFASTSRDRSVWLQADLGEDPTGASPKTIREIASFEYTVDGMMISWWSRWSLHLTAGGVVILAEGDVEAPDTFLFAATEPLVALTVLQDILDDELAEFVNHALAHGEVHHQSTEDTPGEFVGRLERMAFRPSR